MRVPGCKEAKKRVSRLERRLSSAGLWILVGRATQVTTAPFPEMYLGEKLRQEPSQGPHRPHFSTFLQGLGRCQGGSGSRVKVGWLITTSPPLEALDGVFGTSPPHPQARGGGVPKELAFSEGRLGGGGGGHQEHKVLGPREEEAAAGRNNAGYSFKVASDAAAQAFNKNKRGAPPPRGPGPLAVGWPPDTTSSSAVSSARCHRGEP